MARIAGVDLPRDKRIEIALTYIFGIGLKTSQDLLKMTGINPDTRTRDLTEDEVVKLRDVIDKNVVVEGDLRRERLGTLELSRLDRLLYGLLDLTLRPVPVHLADARCGGRRRRQPHRNLRTERHQASGHPEHGEHHAADEPDP